MPRYDLAKTCRDSAEMLGFMRPDKVVEHRAGPDQKRIRGAIMADPAFQPIPRSVKDHTGSVFGRLTVAGFIGTRPVSAGAKVKNVAAFWCRCECGSAIEVLGRNLTQGIVRSCGCLKAETQKLNGRASRTHGMTNSREHRTWLGIIERCCNVNGKNYKRYGARGIKMCERWRISFEAFYEDMGPRPSGKYSIERINNDGDYEPANCRWATDQEQNRNKRSNNYIHYKDELMTVSEASRLSGVPASTIGGRIKRGCPQEKLFIPYPAFRHEV